MVKFLRIGVTGGIGSGKSLVCSMFAALGFPVLSADQIAKDLMASERLREQITRLLGDSAYLPSGQLNRHYISSRIFSNLSLQRSVNKLVHPRVEAELENKFRELRERGETCVIVEAALIYEAGYDKALDAIVVVDAPEQLRVKRVMKRDGSLASDVRKRMRAQWPAKKKVSRADFVIRNDGAESDLSQSVRLLAAVFKSMVEQR